MRPQYLAWLVIPVLVALVACTTPATPTPMPIKRDVPPDVFETVPAGQLPHFLDKYDQSITQVYQFATDHYDELRWIPCYCGCVALGHTDNASCAIHSMNADGTLTYTSHATECGICFGTTRDVMALYAEGKPLTEIRDFIDAKYGAMGPGTRTPYPRSR